jgi:enamine deaminase RidA (YjgF/YER057c/UK114 family)
MTQSAVQHINPETLHKNPAFTQVVAVTQPARTIYIGGQDAVDAAGNILGKGDIAGQAEQVLGNLRLALQDPGLRPSLQRCRVPQRALPGCVVH